MSTFDGVRHDPIRYRPAGIPGQLNYRRPSTGEVHELPTVVNIDGVLAGPEEAVVSVFDRGFLYGDSVYEVVRTYGGRLFEFDDHLRRLQRSAARLALVPRWDAARTHEECLRTLAASLGGDPPDPGAAPWNLGERALRVVMTRGAGEMGLDPGLAVDPRAIIIAAPLHAPSALDYRRGVGCRIVGARGGFTGSDDSSVKTGARTSHVLATGEARRAGAHEALLLDAGGSVTEGASSNVFAVRGGRLLTPPLTVGILEGVTRGIAIALAREAGIDVSETSLRPDDLVTADEVFITSTSREILPVVSIDGRPIGSGEVGPMTTMLHESFRAKADGETRSR